MKSVCVFAAAMAIGAHAWVLPGTAARQFKDGAPVELKVNKITSPKTHLGYEHYSLRFCRVSYRFVRNIYRSFFAL